MTLSIGDFVGLASDAYLDPPKTGFFTINGNIYTVVDSSTTDPSGYVGYVLYDATENSVIVVNRGTAGTKDKLIDVAMATTDVNLQWSAADALAKQAQTFALAKGAAVYAVGHSLGGTLAQLQATEYGWNGVTFNAFPRKRGRRKLIGSRALLPASGFHWWMLAATNQGSELTFQDDDLKE